ncbi:MAG: type II toxin-antitoxin system RelE/ParE family toxin [Methanosarcinales archaeon]|nr:type II toxin-antitoxin system RelE/ParE family toxin [Methanosarcinales archaeon]
MSYEMRLHPKAASFLNRCNQATKEELKSKIRVLENHAKLKQSGPDIKKIRDANPEAYRLKIDDYRVICVIEEGIVWITEIMHRQKGYR